MIEKIDKKYPALRKKILKRFTININPNIITALALIASMFAGYYFYNNVLYLAALLVLINGFLDILDGEIAKKYKKTSLGDFLDHTFDRLADAFILIGISLNPSFPDRKIGLMALVAVVLVSYLGTQAQALTKKRLYAGITGRADRHALIVIASIATYFYPNALYYGIWMLLILSIITFLQRFCTIYSELKSAK